MSQPRQPRPATRSTALPTLGAAIAAAAAQGCASPVCGDQRADEVRAHGPSAVESARSGRGEAALREVAIALGLRGHGTRPEGPDLRPAGAMPVRRPEPIASPGEAAEVTPAPVEPPDADGRMRVVRPTAPVAPPRPVPQVIPRSHISGGARAVTPGRRPGEPEL